MNPDSLAEARCTPCRGGVPPLEEREAAAYLEQLPEWRLTDAATWIERGFSFPDFRSALAFAVRIGEVAEAEGHHPVLTIGWGACTVRIQSMKIGGLHLNDFILAAKIDDLAGAGGTRC